MEPLTHLDIIKRKIIDLNQLQHALYRWRFLSKKLVFTNGCFDILHLGHIDYLSKASDLGDILIVGVNSDASTSRLKGPHRPINNEEQRSILLAALHFIDAVIVFDDPTPLELIKMVRPDVLVKGSDYNLSNIVGADVVQSYNGQVKTIDFLPGYSTTLIEEKIISGKK
ncbi:MAG: D-glycero-beta-D-manno-heptose 1-phosphate adenylyltransferase [Bacteroidia bacterium]|nr:D-glycero-beta-D-manno-heptose 1-phosphate adenylyltransferase [Bacteroidota bacterium]MBK8587402.1 D-glycero-beta-D-manno-heptose 1-phosphate adenylyltransferase [Bacteroidota bacterium]MBP9791155.1 D-glycero-beta-D-manno-heptose 1-phosphate adenylyltransferase [Bacteroidia bacterium]MBP9923393.1 D-glycero-beta-D-manno-heptose 1-phosphate adenylyltransferase [Bacteroidia bacterium]